MANNRLEVANVEIIKKTVPDSKELNDILTLMKKHGTPNPKSLLPKTPWHEVKFELKNTYAGFANGIRRTLIEELPVKCLDFDEQDFERSDEYILIDQIKKNINLIPIKQELRNMEKYYIYLYKYNDTNDIINVTTKDIYIAFRKPSFKEKATAYHATDIPSKLSSKTMAQLSPRKGITTKEKKISTSEIKKKSKNKKSKVIKKGSGYIKHAGILNISDQKTLPLNELIPDENITIIRLRPNKYVAIKKLQIITGYCKNDAAKFTLLDNVSYRPYGLAPYDNFKHTGTRSATVNPTHFIFSFMTASNILPKTVINTMASELTRRLINALNKVEEYKKTDQKKEYYLTNKFEVSVAEDIKTYKFIEEYITLAFMVAQKCYILDPNILFCTPSVDRYDNEIAIIRLKHPDSNNLLIKAIKECINDIEIVRVALTK